MSGPARTAEIWVELHLKITDTATEGEMVDAVHAAIRKLGIDLHHPNATAEMHLANTKIKTNGIGGSL